MTYKMKGIKSFGEGTPLLNKKGKEIKIIGEHTTPVSKDKKGNEFSLARFDTEAGVNAGDTIRLNTPNNKEHFVVDGDEKYIMGGDYKATKTGDKNYVITGDIPPKKGE